ncbi:MAG TPA: general secretion pathway protein GspG [Elusimicrobia bacterium]|nr:general secretion pathway protein GspG [Elusimicrobiota bacterium]HBT61965.1 general secretion pathway protein GspG [Elusimicrobiota bacterium]
MKKAKRFGASGFTLIELMIVVAIIGILAAIAIPKFAELIRKSSEGASKGNLGAIRSALSIYYGDMEGQYPTDLASLTIAGKYLTAVPVAKAPNYHSDSSVVVPQTASNDGGGWSYNNTVGNANLGTVWVNCTHTDTKSSVWTMY